MATLAGPYPVRMAARPSQLLQPRRLHPFERLLPQVLGSVEPSPVSSRSRLPWGRLRHTVQPEHGEFGPEFAVRLTPHPDFPSDLTQRSRSVGAPPRTPIVQVWRSSCPDRNVASCTLRPRSSRHWCSLWCARSLAAPDASPAILALGLNQPTTILEYADLARIEAEARSLDVELVFGTSKGFRMARELRAPLLRLGFPIHDRLGAARLLSVGTRGTLTLFDALVNTLLERVQSNSAVGYSYL